MKKQESKILTDVEITEAEIINQDITDALESNYMPYAMSVIISRAIPEIDGFKPSHRKILYTMYSMGLLTGARTKCANIVGQTMKLNPHGDSAIYDALVRLSKGNDALLLPFIDSKGNFGKVYSRDMAEAAYRYTEAKLTPICAELFTDINKDTVDFVPNHDNSTTEPTLLPTTYPNILVSTNTGIAVGMASQICGFNLEEVCQTTIEYIKNPNHDIMSTLLAPDFTTGGELIYDANEIKTIYETGRGSFKVRAKWRYIKEENLIEIYEIPYSTTAEAIVDKVADLIKAGKIREISDMRDEIDVSGLKLAIDLKKGVDPDALMNKLFKLTTLMDSFSCNFNILINGRPKVLGIRQILDEWISWRESCIYRRTKYELVKKQEQMHQMQGLRKILDDIDKAIKIIRQTEKEKEVVPNLISAFGIDTVQAEYIADIKLRNINKEYILKKTKDIDNLKSEIEELETILADSKKIKKIIISELKQVIKKYPSSRRTSIIYADKIDTTSVVDTSIDDYNVGVFLTEKGYFKKISAQSLGSSSSQKYKDADRLKTSEFGRNSEDVLFFSNKQQVYICKLNDFENMKTSSLGVYLPSYLEMDESEQIVEMILPKDYSANLIFFFKNGKAAKIPLSAYLTKNRRRKLIGAYTDISPLIHIVILNADTEILVRTTDGRALVFNSAQMQLKTSRTAQGVTIINLKKGAALKSVCLFDQVILKDEDRYRCRNIPATGAIVRDGDLRMKE